MIYVQIICCTVMTCADLQQYFEQYILPQQYVTKQVLWPQIFGFQKCDWFNAIF